MSFSQQGSSGPPTISPYFSPHSRMSGLSHTLMPVYMGLAGSCQMFSPLLSSLEEVLEDVLLEELLDDVLLSAVAPVQSSMHSSGSRQQLPFRSLSNSSGVAKG